MTSASGLIAPAKIKTCRRGLHSFTGRQCEECVKSNRLARYAANPEKYRASVAAWQSSNPEKVKTRMSKYYVENKEMLNEKHSKWVNENPEKAKKNIVEWCAKNKDSVRIYSHTRRARKRENGGKLSKGLADKLFKLQKGKCACCKKLLGDNYHMDHIMPLAKGGSNTDDNMQLLTATCNLQKRAKDPIDFMQERGFLI